MWTYEKKLQFPVNIKKCDPEMARLILTALGGPDGEMGASNRYLHQRYAMPYPQIVALLTDIGSEEFEPLCYMLLFQKNFKLHIACKSIIFI